MSKVVRVGSRGSDLALWQTRHVIAQLEAAHPGLQTELTIIKTQGDRILDVPLAAIGDRGLFVREIEEALLERRIDFAVHSLKDLPTTQPAGLLIAAILPRVDARDAMLTNSGAKYLDQLPAGAVVGTSSLRRKAQFLAKYPTLAFKDVRGNVPTRIAKLDAGEYDAIILAAAGLDRLGLGERITQRVPMASCLPAVGQGALAIESREADAETRALLAVLEHAPSRMAITAERAFLRELEGGCQVPIGAYATVAGAVMRIAGVVASVDGTRVVRADGGGASSDAEQIGRDLAAKLKALGAEEILAEVRASGVT